MAATQRQAPEFEITSTDEGGVRVVAVRGEIDVATAPELAGHLYEALEMGAPAVVVDLCAVEFMDSSALAALLRGRGLLLEAGARLAVACVPAGAPAKALEISGVQQVIEVYADCAAAVAVVNVHPPA